MLGFLPQLRLGDAADDKKEAKVPEYKRYAIYYLPPHGPLAQFGAEWLGWDVVAGISAERSDALPVDPTALTQTPRKYGFHATIKPPFRLAEDVDVTGLTEAFEGFCSGQAPVVLEALEVARLGRFLALIPTGHTAALNALAGAAVEALDTYRAPLNDAELARRRQSRLTPRQETLLAQWGYPYVMDEFRFHMTLTSKLPKAEAIALQPELARYLAPILPKPFSIDRLSLVGEDASGMFHAIKCCALSGRADA